MIALNPDKVKFLGQVVDDACARCVPEGERNDAARERLAKHIFAIAEAGEWDEWRLARGALAFMRTEDIIRRDTEARRLRSLRRHATSGPAR